MALVWSGFFLVQVCWSVPLSSVGQQSLSSVGQQPLSSVGNNSYPLWDSHPCPLWDTLPLWLSFCLIGWFGLLVRFWDESMWFMVKVARQPFGSCGLCGNPRSCPL
jgi:hypothetical protein